MIKAEFWFNPDTDEIRRVRITGHAGQNAYGHDILCAGVSALTIATINALEEYAGLQPEPAIKEGFTEFSVDAENEFQQIKAQTLMHSLYLALLNMQQENKDFIQVTIMEEKK